jgi:hypothetical protein
VYDPQTNSWAQQDCIGFIPAPREGHAAALVNDVMYIFGGRTEEGTDLGDLAAFRISSRRWYTFQNMGPSPSPRSGHSMTAHGKQIIVLAGEPSSTPRDSAELSMVYILDTAKIRYPNDQPASNQATRGEQGGGPVRKSSSDARSAIPTSRSGSRQAQASPIDSNNPARNGSGARETPPASAGPVTAPPTVPPTAPIAAPGSANRPVENFSQNNQTGSRLPRASLAQAPAGPPPQGQAPNPRTNGVVPYQNTPRNKSSTGDDRTAGPPLDTVRAMAADNQRQSPLTSPVSRESPKDVARSSGEASPGGQGRRTPTHQQPVSKAKAMEAGEAAPLMHGGPSRQRSLRSQRGQGSMDSSEEGVLGRAGSSRLNSDGAGSLKSHGDEPRSPKLTAHQEALVKELEAAKSRNAWYASELALARKAGYHSGSSSSPTFDERAVNQFGDEDKPMIEAFLTMRAELVRMQQTVEQQAASAAKRIAEVEHQRDAAVSEAAYARAKLAAHSSTPSGTPQSDAARDLDEHSERTDISRRLARALAAQSEHKAKLDSMMNDLSAERRARELAEESAEAAQRRLSEIGQARNPMEVEGLRSELLEAQRTARDEAEQRAQVEEQLRMWQIDKDDLAQKYEEASNRLTNHVSSLEPIKAAVAASAEKADMLERQLEQERQQRDELERKLLQLRADHEEGTAELEATSRKLRDAEELAETHAKEATAHRVALFAGLSKAASVETTRENSTLSEQRIAVLQQSTDRAHAISRSHQEAADTAVQKLRAAEERIAGLEAYQEQSSREGLQIRRQLQAALRDVQSHQAEIRELRSQLETNQRDASALAVQHGALKNLLGERGINMSDSRRSPMMDNSPTTRFGTPEQNRVRELEQQLQSSLKAHEETKHSFESREQEADRNYREKIEQLENDYQSAVHYVKGTEKMLKRMKDELSKYKTQNTQLRHELESVKPGEASKESSGNADWESEREALQKSIEDIRAQTSTQISTLEVNLTTVQRELAATRSDRDLHKMNHESLMDSVGQTQSELAQLKEENSRLETRAIDAEQKVTMLLDQVGQSVGNYRRQSQIQASQRDSTLNGGANGGHHNREQSSSTLASTDQSSQGDGPYNDTRGSLALDNLASELDALRSHWESNTRTYRISNQYDFERTPTQESSSGGGEFSDSLASWRKRLEEEEERGANGSSSGAGLKEAVPKEQGMI